MSTLNRPRLNRAGERLRRHDPDTRRRSFGCARRLLGGAAVIALALAAPVLPAGAQRAATGVKPWLPPSADSATVWAAQARALFQTSSGDSATGPNQRAYDLVGKAARRMLQSFRRDEWTQTPVLERALDSLALDTDVMLEPSLADFLLMVVRNPFKPAADAVGYLFWHRGSDLRYQGVVLEGGFDPRMRVWWTAKPDGPYEWGIVTRGQGASARWRLVLLRLNPDGYMWRLIQIENEGLDMSPEGEASWADLNSDDRPELVTWSRDPNDSSFEICSGCPDVLVERTFTEHESGFDLHDSRIVPSPWASFVLFIDLLRDGNRTAAARLLADPARLPEAIAQGWGLRGRGPSWKLEYAEPDQPWPRWLAVRHLAGKGRPLYIVHFTHKEGRWILQRWAQSGAAAPSAAKKEGSTK